MVPPAVDLRPDPRRVVSPLDPYRVEQLLCKYGLLDGWSHIIDGLRVGFDVGIREQPVRTLIF